MTVMNILEQIIAHKRKEVEQHRKAAGTELLLQSSQLLRPTISMKTALEQSETGIIAEFKRKSPSKGWIHPDARIGEVLPLYEEGGATASSVLTDETFFGGTLDDLRQARESVGIPLLRKEFIIDEYQLYQARAAGADAVLLIASALPRETCSRFAALAHRLGLEVVLELHGEEELDYIENTEADMIGINNRNLTTFATDVTHSFRMIERLPAGKVCISESGISSPDTVRRLRDAGFRGFLLGENFMKHEQPGAALSDFIQQLKS